MPGCGRGWTRRAPHLVDPFLVLVSLLFRNQQFRQRTVDPLHQGVGSQARPQNQLAGTVQQHRVGVSAVVVRSRRRRRGSGDAHQVGAPRGERIAAGTGDASQRGQQFGVFDGGTRGRLRPGCLDRGALLLREGIQRFVDPQS